MQRSMSNIQKYVKGNNQHFCILCHSSQGLCILVSDEKSATPANLHQFMDVQGCYRQCAIHLPAVPGVLHGGAAAGDAAKPLMGQGS